MEERKAGRRAELVVLGILIVAAGATGLWSLHIEPTTPTSGQLQALQDYGQTWTNRLGDTTCDDWVNRMTPPQRSAAAARLLNGSRIRDGQRLQPVYSLATDFEAEISRTCLKPTSVVTDVASSVYSAEHAEFSR